MLCHVVTSGLEYVTSVIKSPFHQICLYSRINRVGRDFKDYPVQPPAQIHDLLFLNHCRAMPVLTYSGNLSEGDFTTFLRKNETLLIDRYRTNHLLLYEC